MCTRDVKISGMWFVVTVDQLHAVETVTEKFVTINIAEL